MIAKQQCQQWAVHIIDQIWFQIILNKKDDEVDEDKENDNDSD